MCGMSARRFACRPGHSRSGPDAAARAPGPVRAHRAGTRDGGNQPLRAQARAPGRGRMNAGRHRRSAAGTPPLQRTHCMHSAGTPASRWNSAEASTSGGRREAVTSEAVAREVAGAAGRQQHRMAAAVGAGAGQHALHEMEAMPRSRYSGRTATERTTTLFAALGARRNRPRGHPSRPRGTTAAAVRYPPRASRSVPASRDGVQVGRLRPAELQVSSHGSSPEYRRAGSHRDGDLLLVSGFPDRANDGSTSSTYRSFERPGSGRMDALRAIVP